jgi:hypothetical protein
MIDWDDMPPMPWLCPVYILDGRTPVETGTDLRAYLKWMQANPEARGIGLDHIGDAKISTVFLGWDQGIGFLAAKFGKALAPLLFETMVFGGKHHLFQRRYSTYDDAERGHAEAVKMVRESIQ